jgi:hypothetical protein
MALAGQAEFSRIVVSEGMYQNLVLAFFLCNLVSSDKHMSWIWTDGLPLRTYYFGIYGEGMCGFYSTRCPFLKPRMRELTLASIIKDFVPNYELVFCVQQNV